MPRALHSVYSKVKWTAKYDTEDIERTIDSPMIGSGETHVCKPFEFRLDGETKAVTGTHPAQAVFEVGIWRMAGESEGDDSVWRWMLENARNLSMTVICAGNMVRGTCTRITEIIKDNRGNSHLFALRSVKPLKLVKGGQEALDVNVEIMIKAPGTLAHQLPRLLPVVLPSPLPRPFTIHNNLGPLISRPADLAFKVISGLPEQVSYVWAYKDKLAAASQYLEHLVDDREDPVDGFGLLDAGPSVEPANDDSDDEEDANRQKLEESNARKALRENVRQAALRRSGTPEPPEKKRRVDTDIAGEGQPVSCSLTDAEKLAYRSRMCYSRPC